MPLVGPTTTTCFRFRPARRARRSARKPSKRRPLPSPALIAIVYMNHRRE